MSAFQPKFASLLPLAGPIAMLGLLVGVAPPPVAADEIPWSPERPLRWADFAGPVAPRTASENVAVTASSLGWSYEYEIERSGSGCRYRITAITASATFDRARSWSKPEHRTAAILAHEQGHFDITQIYKVLFESLAREQIGATGDCGGGGTRRTQKLVADAINSRVGPLYEEVWQRHNDTQESYDLASAHGINEAAQREWTRHIATALHSGPEALPVR